MVGEVRMRQNGACNRRKKRSQGGGAEEGEREAWRSVKRPKVYKEIFYFHLHLGGSQIDPSAPMPTEYPTFILETLESCYIGSERKGSANG